MSKTSFSFNTRTRVCACDQSFVRVNLQGNCCRLRRDALFTTPDVPCNILQMSLGAHATGFASVCAKIIKIADCVRMAVFFFSASSRCYSFHSPLPSPTRRKFYACKFLEEIRGGDIGTRSFYSAINFIPGANVTRYRGFCKYYRARSLQAGNIDCNAMRT